MRERLPLLAFGFLLLPLGCAGTPTAPFDSFKSAPITAFRLQNFEPPPQVAAAPATPTAPTLIPGLPPEIMKWVQAGASALPPGLLPPGLIPGLGNTAPTPQPTTAVDTTPRFHNFRILGQTQVMDEKLRSELIDIFGFEKNFDDTHGSCVYAEFGFSFARIAQPPADVLVSFSCDQVQAQNFTWPYSKSGLTPDTVKRLAKAAQSMFGGG